jgi:hypothetical protein
VPLLGTDEKREIPTELDEFEKEIVRHEEEQAQT